MLSGGVPAAHDLQLHGRPLVRCRQNSLGGAGRGTQQNTAYGVQQHNGRKKAQQRSPKRHGAGSGRAYHRTGQQDGCGCNQSAKLVFDEFLVHTDTS